MSGTIRDIRKTTERLTELLVERNQRYGDSALDPVRLFSKADPVEQLLVRIDDKLSRIARGDALEDEDTLYDLAGYLVLLIVSGQRKTGG